MRLWLILASSIAGVLVHGLQVLVAEEQETKVKVVWAEPISEHLKGMTRISAQPVWLTATGSIGCGGVITIEGDSGIGVGDIANPIHIANPAQNDGPHDPATAVVHANDVALDYRKKHPRSHAYPVGSVFLKEKFISGDADKLRLATVMERLKDDGTIDDWQFSITMFPSGTTEILRGNTAAACADCHSGFEKRGFLSQHTATKVSTPVAHS